MSTLVWRKTLEEYEVADATGERLTISWLRDGDLGQAGARSRGYWWVPGVQRGFASLTEAIAFVQGQARLGASLAQIRDGAGVTS